MSEETATDTSGYAVRRWKMATAVLAVLTFTLLITTAVLRTRADTAGERAREATSALAAAEAEAAAQAGRNEQLFEQMSQASERMVEALSSLPQQKVTAAQVERAIAAAKRGKAGTKVQQRLTALCAQALVEALRDTYSGADVEAGARQALEYVEVAEPACRTVLG